MFMPVRRLLFALGLWVVTLVEPYCAHAQAPPPVPPPQPAVAVADTFGWRNKVVASAPDASVVLAPVARFTRKIAPPSPAS